MYRAGLFRTVAEQVSKYKLDLVAVQEVRWDGGGTEPAGLYRGINKFNLLSTDLNTLL
jgi:hypothetical protein